MPTLETTVTSLVSDTGSRLLMEGIGGYCAELRARIKLLEEKLANEKLKNARLHDELYAVTHELAQRGVGG